MSAIEHLCHSSFSSDIDSVHASSEGFYQNLHEVELALFVAMEMKNTSSNKSGMWLASGTSEHTIYYNILERFW